MTRPASEIREEFLRFFEKKGHQIVSSASLVPQADPTLMFTNAGMVPFKRVFLGEESRPYSRATTSQKVMRVSGKHNDLENVGRTPRHHTFFEMLGNFSFGDYFKAEAIDYAWELLVEHLGIAPERLVSSVFLEDDESYDLWRDQIGLPEEKIFRLGADENFWSMGDTGPCGPCTEIHIDFGVRDDCTSEVCDPSCDCGRWLELWNLVFMQYNRSASGQMEKLPKPSVDTGGGLERFAWVLQGVNSDYETDLFVPLLERAGELAGVARGQNPESDVSLQVVADHARALTFLIGDGVLPSNEGRGYVLRRILRRASRHGVLLGVERPFVYEVANKVIDEMVDAYPELLERRSFIADRIRREEERFLETLSRGLNLLEEKIAELEDRGEKVLAGEVLFRLYDTYGFPVDLTADILADRGMSTDQSGFDQAMAEQRAKARAAWTGSGDSTVAERYSRIANEIRTNFTGYDGLEGESSIAVLMVGGNPAPRADAGDEVELVFEGTPFYAESGGQIGDRGSVDTESGTVEVLDTQKPVAGIVVHRGKVTTGTIHEGQTARLRVDPKSRAGVVRNHSATHLLHAALRTVLGEQAMQKGSLVAADRLRFDFTHDVPLSEAEIEQIEDIANQWIENNVASDIRVMNYRQAIESGAVAIFEEKYGDEVRVVRFGDCSTELCGGTHARATGEIGFLKIVSETGIQAGVRRIEALSGLDALRHLREQERSLRRAADLLKVAPDEVPDRVERFLRERKEAQREVDALRTSQRGNVASDLVDDARALAAGKALAARVDGTDAKSMRALVDDLRNRLGSGVVFLAAETDGKVLLAAGVTKDLIADYKAGELIRELAALVGGGGGGRPDFAQAGGKDASQIGAAIDLFYELVGVGSAE